MAQKSAFAFKSRQKQETASAAVADNLKDLRANMKDQYQIQKNNEAQGLVAPPPSGMIVAEPVSKPFSAGDRFAARAAAAEK